MGDGQSGQADTRGLARGPDRRRRVESQRVADGIGEGAPRQHTAKAHPLRRRTDETVHVAESQAGVVKGALDHLPVDVGRITVAQVALLRHRDAGEPGIGKFTHAGIVRHRTSPHQRVDAKPHS